MAETLLFPTGPLMIVDRSMRKRRGQPFRTGSDDDDKIKISVMKTQKSGARARKTSGQPNPGPTCARSACKQEIRFVQSLDAEGKPAKRKPSRKSRSGSTGSQISRSSGQSDPMSLAKFARPGSACSTSTTTSATSSTRSGSPFLAYPAGSSMALYARDHGLSKDSLTVLPFFLDTSKFFYPHQNVLPLTFDPISKVYFPEGLTDDCCVSAIVYTVSGRLEHTYRISGLPTSALSLHQQSISRLRKRIASGRITDHTICAVTILATYEYCKGDDEASDAHFNGIVNLIKARGGFNAIDKRVHVKIYRALLTPSVDKLSRPSFPQLLRSHPPLSQTLGLDSDVGFQQEVELLKHDLHPVVLDSLLQLFRLTQAINYAIDNSLNVNPFALDEDIMCIQYRLLALDEAECSTLDIASKSAALAYTKILSRETPFDAHHCNKIAEVLKRSYTMLSEDVRADDLGIWIAILAALVAQNTQDRLWGLEEIESCCRDRGIFTLQQLQRFMEQTIWAPAVLNPLLGYLPLQFGLK